MDQEPCYSGRTGNNYEETRVKKKMREAVMKKVIAMLDVKGCSTATEKGGK